jgi:protoporphyrinogen oxidase
MSYYMRPGSDSLLSCSPPGGGAYRFENGGGHWIFGGDRAVLHFIHELAPVKSYERRSSVYFPDNRLYVPYPLQNHLRYLDEQVAADALVEMMRPTGQFTTLKEWLCANFGETLCELFFYPFHELYTANLYDRVAPQDAYKSPVSPALAARGALYQAPTVGYNAAFVYPEEGLDTLVRHMAERSIVEYGKEVNKIDVNSKTVSFSDGSERPYQRLISTLPLNKTMEMAGVSVAAESDPYTSVLVLNIGAVRGDRCPDHDWLYIPHSEAGFHRVGFYSNVDTSFLPEGAQNRVSIYVERTYPGGAQPDQPAVADYSAAVVRELQNCKIGVLSVMWKCWIRRGLRLPIPGRGPTPHGKSKRSKHYKLEIFIKSAVMRAGYFKGSLIR